MPAKSVKTENFNIFKTESFIRMKL